MRWLTKKRAIELHRDMWNNIADTIEKYKKTVDVEKAKSDFCRSYGYGSRIMNNCFLCEYSEFSSCKNCPVMWGDSVRDTCTLLYGHGMGLYYQVKFEGTWKGQAELARKIANLPEKE